MKGGQIRMNVDGKCAFCSVDIAADELACVDAMRLTDIGEWMGMSAEVFGKNFASKEACSRCAEKVGIFRP